MKLANKVITLFEESKEFEQAMIKWMEEVNKRELNRKDADKYIRNKVKSSKFKKGKDFTDKEVDDLISDLIDVPF